MSGLYFPPNTRLMVQPPKDFPLIYRRQLALLVVFQNVSDGTTHVQGGIVRCKDKKKFHNQGHKILILFPIAV